jgi:hypothetical protein
LPSAIGLGIQRAVFSAGCLRRRPPLYLAALLCAAVGTRALATPCGGDLDRGFGNAGVAHIGARRSYSPVTGGLGQPDGKLLAIASHPGFELIRPSTSGHLDTTFGQRGLVDTIDTLFTLPPDPEPGLDSRDVQGKALALQTDGRIVAVGSAG